MGGNSGSKGPYFMCSCVLAGIQDDDIVLSTAVCSGLPFLLSEAVVTEKLDGGNCCIYRGKVAINRATHG